MSLAVKRKEEAARPESSLSHWFRVFPGPSFVYSLYEACMWCDANAMFNHP